MTAKDIVASLASNTRARILDTLLLQHSMDKESISIVELSELCDISPALAAHHIKALEAQALVLCLEVGNKKMVSIQDFDTYLSILGCIEELNEILYLRAERIANKDANQAENEK